MPTYLDFNYCLGDCSYVAQIINANHSTIYLLFNYCFFYCSYIAEIITENHSTLLTGLPRILASRWPIAPDAWRSGGKWTYGGAIYSLLHACNHYTGNCIYTATIIRIRICKICIMCIICVYILYARIISIRMYIFYEPSPLACQTFNIIIIPLTREKIYHTSRL